MALDLAGIAQTGKAAAPPLTVYTAQVVRADESGLWVVPIGEDTSSPVGPCRGGWTANGTRVPPGALVGLFMTEDGPWAIGVDNPALTIADGTLAPFPDPSFELSTTGVAGGFTGPTWGDFWSNARRHTNPGAVPYDKYRRTIVEGVAAHGLKALQVDATHTVGISESDDWNVPPGSSLEISVYARGQGDAPLLYVDLYSNDPSNYPGPFTPGVQVHRVLTVVPGFDWLRYRATVTIPPTHTRVSLFLYAGNDGEAVGGGESTVWLDNVDADLVEINPSAAHQDFMRRAALVMLGGGTRQVTAGGNVSWSQSFTIAGAGMEAAEALDGRFAVAQPANGTVIPVHSSAARVSHTVAGGVIALNPDDALWYELPIGAAATSQPARFHIVGSSAADGYVVPPHWILVVRRASAWSPTSHALEYRWGDGRHQDPLRTPSLNGGWIDGTIAPRYTKTTDNQVIMRGRVRSGAGSAFTLPQGYWPGVQHEAFVRDGAGAAALITVSTAGVVTTAGNNTDHSIATSFVAEQ